MADELEKEVLIPILHATVFVAAKSWYRGVLWQY